VFGHWQGRTDPRQGPHHVGVFFPDAGAHAGHSHASCQRMRLEKNSNPPPFRHFIAHFGAQIIRPSPISSTQAASHGGIHALSHGPVQSASRRRRCRCDRMNVSFGSVALRHNYSKGGDYDRCMRFTPGVAPLSETSTSARRLGNVHRNTALDIDCAHALALAVVSLATPLIVYSR
jgi:hypothetical protein